MSLIEFIKKCTILISSCFKDHNPSFKTRESIKLIVCDCGDKTLFGSYRNQHKVSRICWAVGYFSCVRWFFTVYCALVSMDEWFLVIIPKCNILFCQSTLRKFVTDCFTWDPLVQVRGDGHAAVPLRAVGLRDDRTTQRARLHIPVQRGPDGGEAALAGRLQRAPARRAEPATWRECLASYSLSRLQVRGGGHAAIPLRHLGLCAAWPAQHKGLHLQPSGAHQAAAADTGTLLAAAHLSQDTPATHSRSEYQVTTLPLKRAARCTKQPKYLRDHEIIPMIIFYSWLNLKHSSMKKSERTFWASNEYSIDTPTYIHILKERSSSARHRHLPTQTKKSNCSTYYTHDIVMEDSNAVLDCQTDETEKRNSIFVVESHAVSPYIFLDVSVA